MRHPVCVMKLHEGSDQRAQQGGKCSHALVHVCAWRRVGKCLQQEDPTNIFAASLTGC